MRSATWFVAASAFAIACTTQAHAQINEPTGSKAGAAKEVAQKVGGISNPEENQPEHKDDIVVVGTNIRGGVAPGSNVVSLNADDIEAAGQASTTQLLAQIPQLSSFNTLPQIAPGSGSGTAGLTNRPNARGTNDDLLDSVGNTLVLIDGNRASGVGTRQSSADVDGIPSALLERVEANLDGGSAIYGSDAIGGVLNFVTKRKFDGVEVSGHYGFADKYSTWDATVIAGKEWSTGGFYASYSHSENTVLFRGDREYYRVLNYTTGLETGTTCDEPNVSMASGARLYAVNADGTIRLTNGVAVAGTANAPVSGSPNFCTLGKQGAMFPEASRHNVNAVFSQDFGDSVRLTVRGRFASNSSTTYDQPFTSPLVIKPNNPYYQPLTGAATVADRTAIQTVLVSFGPVYGDHRPATNSYKQYGVNAELAWDINDNWHSRFIVNWDRSQSFAGGPEYNSDLVTAYTQSATLNNSACSAASDVLAANPNPGPARDQALAAARATCLNPYNIEASTPALLANLANWEVDNRATDRIFQAKAIVDGSLFDLPGGPLKVAVGAEYLHDRYEMHRFTGRPDKTAFSSRIDGVGTRSNWSLFAEAELPIVSSDNEMPLVKELKFSVQGRYDHFSNTGGIFNPKFGFSYKPVEWFKLRGSWSKSFRAPSAVDVLTAQGTLTSTGLLSRPEYARMRRAADVAANTIPTTAILLAYNPGADPGLVPQSGKDWSIGGEFTPFRGFQASISYYHIELTNPFVTPSPVVGIPTWANYAIYNPAYDASRTTPPTQAEIDAFQAEVDRFLDRSGNAAAKRAEIAGQPIYVLFDNRLTNEGGSKIGGIDYNFRYTSKTGFGSISFSAGGNIKLQNEQRTLTGSVFTDQLLSNAQSKHRITVTAGMTYGESFRAQVTWNHSDGYDVNRSATLPQDHVGAFNVVNLFASYKFTGDDLFQKGLTLSLAINNILDSEPPLYFSNGGIGTANGSTLGRLVQFGVTKRF